MEKENGYSTNAYNLVVRDYMEMDFKERMKPEPIDMRLANFTLKEVPSKQPTGIINSILKILKVV